MMLRKILSFFQKLYLRPGSLGKNSFIMPPHRIVNPKGLFIGNNVRIGCYSFFVLCERYNDKQYQPKLSIGNNVSIGHDFFIGCTTNITIEDNVLISSRVFIADTIHGYEDISQPVIKQDLTKCSETKIGENSFVGVNACILPGVKIGKNAVIAANAVVTKDIPPFSVAAGNPAKIIKEYSYQTGAWEKK